MSEIKESVKSMCNSIITEPRILIYDNERINYRVGSFGGMEISSESMECYDSMNGYKQYVPSLSSIFSCTIFNYEELNNIELDETTMKRIAKYNKEVEIKKLDEKIKEKEEKIKELDDILKDRDKRVNKLKEFITNIYDIDIEENDYDEWD